MVKKDRQPNCYTGFLSKINVTNILSDPLTKTTDARPVYFTQNLAGLDTIGKTTEPRAALARVFPYPIMVESLARQATKISRFTSIYLN